MQNSVARQGRLAVDEASEEQIGRLRKRDARFRAEGPWRKIKGLRDGDGIDTWLVGQDLGAPARWWDRWLTKKALWPWDWPRWSAQENWSKELINALEQAIAGLRHQSGVPRDFANSQGHHALFGWVAQRGWYRGRHDWTQLRLVEATIGIVIILMNHS